MTREAVNTSTGEVIALPVKYEPKEYLATLTQNDGIAVQKQLSAAYDAAVSALIGPNDVQVEGNRTFKKKSAWRKLARYFNISVDIVKVEREMMGEHFLATVTARAVAPWGQHYEEIGSCSTDEATGRRVITIADAIATASTRASNRAVSNLIAMGEVSAEEIGDRPALNNAPRASAPARTAIPQNGEFLMPFGKTKGTPLSKLSTDDLTGAMEWAASKGKFVEFQDAAAAELQKRMGADDIPDAQFETVPPDAPIDGDDDLPF